MDIMLNDLLNISKDSKDFNEGKITLNIGWEGERHIDHWLRYQGTDEAERCRFALWPFDTGNRTILHEGCLDVVAAQMEERDKWLLLNVFRIKKVYNYRDNPNQERRPCDVEEVEEYKKYRGRIIFRLKKAAQGYNFKLSTYLEQARVEQILPKPYGGVDFPGFNNVCVKMEDLLNYLNNYNTGEDWKNKLSSVKGVYCLNNHDEHKVYIGSAYNNRNCIFSRWKDYFNSYHGGNVSLKELMKKHAADAEDYFLKNFYFSILEALPIGTSDEDIIKREHYWMDVFNSRDPKQGYNNN